MGKISDIIREKEKEFSERRILEEESYRRQEEYQGELIKTEKQRRELRNEIIYGAISLIVFFVIFKLMLFFFIVKLNEADLDAFFFIYASIPTVSITLIMVFLTMGIFRGFKDKDMESLMKKTPGVNQLTGNHEE